MRLPLFVVEGPTASGKTTAAIQLALHLKTEIVSADARQVYTEMCIGTARPTPAELHAVPHHLIAHRSIREPYSAGQFATEALACINSIQKRTGSAIICGGSGLYIKAVCEGLDNFPPVDLQVRDQVKQIQSSGGTEALFDLLQKLDPTYAREVDASNHRRLIRALEVCMSSGNTYSFYKRDQNHKRSFKAVHIGLNIEREELYDRINKRVEQMMHDGLEDEARTLHEYRGLRALETVGYTELFDHFEGKYGLEEAVGLIKRNSRRYAKRQMTWLRSNPAIHWFSPTDIAKIATKDVTNEAGGIWKLLSEYTS